MDVINCAAFFRLSRGIDFVGVEIRLFLQELKVAVNRLLLSVSYIVSEL